MIKSKRLIALLLALVMCLPYVSVPSHAATLFDMHGVDGNVVLDGKNDGVVTVALSANESIGILAIQGTWSTTEDEGTNYLTLAELGSDVMTFTGMNGADPNEGYLIWTDDSWVNPAVFAANQKILFAKYSVPANTPAGTYTVSFVPEYMLDAEYNESYDSFTCKITVTIGGGSEPEPTDPPAHECADTDKDHKCDNGCDVPQGEHKSNAAHPCLDGTCEYCGKPVAATAQHTGGTATCKEKAKCTECGTAYGNVANHYDGDDKDHLCDFGCGAIADDGHHGGNATCLAKAVCDECGESYGELGDHDYGDLIPEKDAVHEQDKLEPGVAAHYQCSVCEKYFTEDEKKETLPEDLIGETPEHTPGEPVKNEDLSTDPTCTEEGTEVSETFCTVCGKLLNTDSVKVPVKTDCTVDRTTVTYQWTGTDSCVAQGTCQYGKVHEAEAVITSEVTVEADCVTPEEITYTATFDVDWAEERTETVTGYVDPTKHAVGAEMCYGPANGLDNESTHHGVYCDKCGEPWDAEKPDEPHVADENGYCDCGYFELIIDFNGGKISQTAPDGIDQTLWEKLVNEQLGGFDATQEIGFVNVAVSIPEPENYGFGFVKEGYRFVGLAYDAEGNQPYEREDIVEPTTLYMVWECNHDKDVHKYTYIPNDDGTTHTVKCACGVTIDEDEPHDFNNADHKCDCEAVETFEVSVTDIHGNSVIEDVPYGTNILAFLEQKVTDGILSTAPNEYNDPNYKIGTDYFANWVDKDGKPIAEDAIVTEAMVIGTTVRSVGWFISNEEWRYTNGDDFLKGWNEIDDAWYYFDMETSVRAEGVTRVPYPTAPIEGNTYAPNAEDLAYWEAHKDTSRYSDATTAMFVFGEDGKFQHDFTGMVLARCYAVNGMIPWHYGLAEVNGEYYYFIGDTSDASFGNSVAMGDVTVSRLNGINGVLDEGATYNFAGGKLSGVDGISNGKYYEDSKLMKGNGLTKYGDEYIYVRSTGEIVVNADYYVPANDLGIVSGMYKFNEDGFMVEPKTTDKNGIVDGIYYRDGKPYYAGLIEIDGSMYYINSSYKVVTGTYYVTKTNEDVTGIAKGTKLVFGEDGKLIPPKNGIYEESGKLYYYENDRIMKGAGVVKLTDEEGETFYIYVRSNGQLATGIYWPTTRNDLLDRGAYNWGSDGRYYPSKA